MVNIIRHLIGKGRGEDLPIMHRTWKQQRYRDELAKSLKEKRELGSLGKDEAKEQLNHEKKTINYKLSKYGTDKYGALRMIDEDYKFFVHNIKNYRGLDKEVALALLKKIDAMDFLSVYSYFHGLDLEIATLVCSDWRRHDFWGRPNFQPFIGDVLRITDDGSACKFVDDCFGYHEFDFTQAGYLLDWCDNKTFVHLLTCLVSRGMVTRRARNDRQRYLFNETFDYETYSVYRIGLHGQIVKYVYCPYEIPLFYQCKKYNPFEKDDWYEESYARYYPKEMRRLLKDKIKSLATLSERIEFIKSYRRQKYIFKMFSTNEIIKILIDMPIAEGESIDYADVKYLYKLCGDGNRMKKKVLKKFGNLISTK